MAEMQVAAVVSALHGAMLRLRGQHVKRNESGDYVCGLCGGVKPKNEPNYLGTVPWQQVRTRAEEVEHGPYCEIGVAERALGEP